MAHEGAGRPVQSGGTDGRGSSTLGRTSPTKERKASAKNGDGTDFPRYFLQLGHDFKRTRGYEMIQELQLMVCNKESGIKGNAARARVMVLLREVQSVLVGLENKIDAQMYEMGVFNVERSELRKELRDEKARELQPLHTIDFRNTDVKDLPHKLRTLFEDNQVLREQVRSLQYAVRSGEAKFDGANQRLAVLEAENANLTIALREVGVSHDLALEMRHLREVARNAEARVRQTEMQAMALQEQLETERRMLSQQARHYAAKQAMLESRLNAALGVAPTPSRTAAAFGGGLGSSASSTAGGGVRKSAAPSATYDLYGSTGGDDVLYAASFAGGRVAEALAAPIGPSALGIGSLLDGAGGIAGLPGTHGRSSAHSKGPSLGASGGGMAGGAAFGAAIGGGPPSAIAGRGGGSGARDTFTSPPRSPSGRSISHSPGSVIPSLYPLFNSKPRSTHAFTPESTSWLVAAYGNGSTGGGAGGSVRDGPQGQVGSASHSSGGYATLPPPQALARTASVSERLAGAAGPMGRPGSGLAGGSSSQGLELLPPAIDGPLGQLGRPQSSGSATAGGAGGPGEAVRAINSAAVVTSRTLLPSVGSGSGRAGPHTAGAGGVVVGGGGGPGILGLRTMLGGGSGSMLRRSYESAGVSAAADGIAAEAGLATAAAGSGRSNGMQELSPDPAAAAQRTSTLAAGEDEMPVAEGEAVRIDSVAVGGGVDGGKNSGADASGQGALLGSAAEQTTTPGEGQRQ